MTKKITKIFYLVALLFWTGIFIFSLTKLVFCNGLGNLFQFKKIEVTDYQINQKKNSETSLTVIYNYSVYGQKYQKKIDVSKKYFRDRILPTNNKLHIKYNTKVPQISYISELALEQRKLKTGIVLSIIFLIIFSILYFIIIKFKFWKITTLAF